MGVVKEVKDLRDREILTFNNEEVKKLEIRGPDREIVLNKAETGWALEKPTQAKADETEVKTFLSNLRSLRAQDYRRTGPWAERVRLRPATNVNQYH